MSNNTTNIHSPFFKKRLLPLGLVVITGLLWWLITSNPPENKRGKKKQTAQMAVEVQVVQPQNYQVLVNSFGTVSPRTQGVLYAQVSGQIVKVSEQFRAGGFFNKGDVLVQLDDRDYRAEVAIAKATYISAKQHLQEEQARVQQAQADWQRLGNGTAASDLVLRKPQLAAAQASVKSAQARLTKAELSLERTHVVAPYSGRIISQHVDIGQVVSGNSALAKIYAIDSVEVRLPIKNKDLPLVQLPEAFYDDLSSRPMAAQNLAKVTLSSDLVGKQQWQAKLIRTEGTIDNATQQLYVVAKIADPYKRSAHSAAQIKIGQYVTAEIVGRKIRDALVIPSSAIYQGSYVYIVDDQGLLHRKDIAIRWQNGLESIVEQGLMPGDKLVLTALGQVHSGTPVSIKSDDSNIAGVDDPSKAAGERSPRKMPKERREKFEKMAAEQGITFEEFMAKRKAQKGNR